MVVALGITMTGDKRFLGFVETDTENEQTPFLRSLVERGLDVSQGLLVIVDGGKGLRAAVRHAFRHRALVQRCQWHTREHVVSDLANEQPVWRQRLQRAYTRPEYDEALAALQSLPASEPIGGRQSGGRPCCRMACWASLDDTASSPSRALRSGRRSHWQSSQRQRWLATALLDIEPRLRKVMGYRHLPRLRDALKRELKIDTIEDESRVSNQESRRVSTRNDSITLHEAVRYMLGLPESSK